MKLKIHLPKELEEKYYEIESTFGDVAQDWKRYNDEIIPEDEKFAQDIINFLIEVVDYVGNNFEKLDLVKYKEFLAYYYMHFYYGPNGDCHNYLDFDESINGEGIADFFWELRKDEDSLLTRKQLQVIKDKLMKLLKEFD